MMDYLNHIIKSNNTYFILDDGEFMIRHEDPEVLEEWEDYFNQNSTWEEHLKTETPFESLIRNPYNRQMAIEEDDAGKFQDLIDESSEFASITVEESADG